uniref:Uncharacterized protein n=1 Tax=Neogobius melanostomus TaxID=47308 RepID=A0A8C6TJD3_9GOBI
MADHMMMPMQHHPHGFRMGMTGPPQHSAQPGMRSLPNGQIPMHYRAGPQNGMEAMRQRPGGMVGPGGMNGSIANHHPHHQQMMTGNMMYNSQGPPQQHPHHLHAQQPQHQQGGQQQQYHHGNLTSQQQLMASMHLQKLNTQYHGHPLNPANGHHLANGAQYRMGRASCRECSTVEVGGGRVGRLCGQTTPKDGPK